jgi:acyl-CoA reductase-like NAD-dependent aldehyde dehydrogenase
VSAAEHRTIAIENFNRAQDLFHQARTPEQDKEMLQAALTSRHHWRLVGGERQFAVSDWLMSRIYATFNEPRLAVEFAISALSHNQKDFPIWLKASLYEGMARAYKCADEIEEYERYKALAITTLEAEPNQEDREIISSQIREIL